MKKRLFSATLSLILAVSFCLSLCSCAPPKLEEVKEEFVNLIEKSANVNQILFGEGLSVYGSMIYDKEHDVHYSIIRTKADGKLLLYYDKDKKENISLRFGEKGEGEKLIFSDEEKGIYLYKSDFVNKEPTFTLPNIPSGYDVVRFDERCTSISEIASLANEVYSQEYLSQVFESIMGKADEGGVDIDRADFSKYIEITDPFDNKKYLLRADEKTYKAVTLEERIYDFDTMKIVKPSKKSYVTVEIKCYGSYLDKESASVKVGWSLTNLNFTLENGSWRLDSPTY